MFERMQVVDVAQIYELWNDFAAAANDRDMECWLSFWLDDGIQMPPGAPRRVGKAEIRQGMQPLFERFDISNMTIQPEEVRILGDWANAHGTYEFEMVPKQGGEAKRCSGKFLDILQKQVDGSWKIAVDCHNYDTPSESAWWRLASRVPSALGAFASPGEEVVTQTTRRQPL
jgi:uncharacterized protein (TIGR02246 family)